MAKTLFVFAVSKSSDGEWMLDGKRCPRFALHLTKSPWLGLRIILGAYSVNIGKQPTSAIETGERLQHSGGPKG